MIQRKQTLFLLLSVLVFIATYYFPFGKFGGNELHSYSVLDSTGAVNDQIQNYYFALPLSIAATLTLVSIFLYGNLKRQMTVVRFSFILFTLSVVLLAFYIRSAASIFSGESFAPGISFYLPFVSSFLNMYALRLMRKDEKLIKSVDRIR